MQIENLIAAKINGTGDIRSKHLQELLSHLADAKLNFETGNGYDLPARIAKRLDKKREEVIDILKNAGPLKLRLP